MVGQDHPDVASSYNNIGNVYDHQGKYEEALVQYRRALEIKIRVFGQDHPGVAKSKYNIALLHKGRQETEKARQLFLECEKIYAAVHGPDHSATVDAARQASRCV